MTAPKIGYVDDWSDRLLGRFYEQFKGKSNLTALARDVLAPQFQALEEAGQQLLSLPSISDGEGAQFDVLGRLIEESRAGASDATYMLMLRARVAANRSNGTPEEIYEVLRALHGSSTTTIYYSQSPIRSFVMRVGDVVSATEAAVGRELLGAAKDATARAILEWQESADAALFRCDSGPGFDAGVLAGAAQA